jgi:hypothetical protein
MQADIDRGAYDHHGYVVEMLDALETWANYVECLIAPAGVARLR